MKKYSVTLPVPTSIRFDIGCGTRDGGWWSNNRTPTRTIYGGGRLSAACKEAAGTAQRCGWWGSTILVGMPFSGQFNGADKAPPGSHEVHDGLDYADWSTDLMGPEAAAVRARVYAPINGATYTMKVQRTWKSPCAGTGVYVLIYRNGNAVGAVSYAHLANVQVVQNQTLTTGTVLGYLKWWSNCGKSPDYDVSNPENRHTHIEVGTVSGSACYMPIGAKVPLPDTRLIGKIVPGASATCTA